ncbi:tetraspanin-9-like isoform X1 [Paramacrobiotus metropolitanus]|uniref:tetraspanin-9-like isoform X1 n=1 Tax=Paramacrobiotus metropolitanus TaxID=2943436 RepID=UPI002445DA00|nr:tetraspanin-9-like isoform X1 [Paramacrobiotus metropolitanus]
MAIGLGAKLARLLLLTFNLIFWLSGIGLIGAGIWMFLTEKGEVFAIVQPEGSVPMIKIAAVGLAQLVVYRIMFSFNRTFHLQYGIIGIGCFVLLVGFLGCCGAMHENRCMLVTYFAVVLVILLAEIVGGILIVVFKGELDSKLQNNLQENLQKNYGLLPDHKAVTGGFDTIQKNGKCCGVVGPNDYALSNWTKVNEAKGQKNEVPDSCCAPGSNPCEKYPIGCYDQVKKSISDVHGILIGVGAGIAALELLGMIFAICLCRNIDYDI